MKLFPILIISLSMLVGCCAKKVEHVPRVNKKEIKKKEVYHDIYWNEEITNTPSAISEDDALPVFDSDKNKPNKIDIPEE